MLFWCVVITIFYIVCFEGVACGPDDVSNNRLKCAQVPGIRLPFNDYLLNYYMRNFCNLIGSEL